MRVRAPFHVASDYGILFAFRAELAWVDRVTWDYFACQRLATQADQLSLEYGLHLWRRGHRFHRKKPGTGSGTQSER